ncbi:TraR/DksA C4-type zinc finger protein [Luteimonas suaedae]|uniref:TraR/DksA C4-type zinc finger protein n=1 Tax=Luteimonas suaedae TaxID=2605430 RepID=UPI0011ED94BB|nr:TraR/DksA C4-type zinc finger protein [Luteimonas suaedae]
MSTADHAPLIAQLERKRSALLDALAAPDESARPVALDQTLQGRVSRIDAIAQQQMAKAGRSRLKPELDRIDAALERHRRGRYGRCCRCGEDVPLPRLQADPATPFCRDCADELAEERENAGRGYRD